MNQKQRDYLIKRLQSLAAQKKASFKVEDPNPEPFIKKLKPIIPGELFAKLHKDLKPSGYKPYNTDRMKYLTNNSESVRTKEFYSNFVEVNKEFEEYCIKHYKVFDERLKSIDDRCQEYCDKIVFAETYDEALKIIQEFTKF